MIWLKTWRETRLRVYWSLLVLASAIALQLFTAPSTLHLLATNPAAASRLMAFWTGSGLTPANSTPSEMWWRVYLPMTNIFATMITILLAGSGINTQTAYGMRQGVHPSMLYTLSLPVPRWKWVAARAGLGLAATAAFVIILLAIPPALAPVTGGQFAWGVVVTAAAPLFFSTVVFYALTVWLASFLDELWQGMFSLLAVFGAVGVEVSLHTKTPGLFPYMPGSPPSFGGAVFCAALSAVFLCAAIVIVNRREF